MLWLRGANTLPGKLIIRVINSELVPPIFPRYTVHQRRGQTDGRTDGRTTYDSNTALALRASRGKNDTQQCFISIATI